MCTTFTIRDARALRVVNPGSQNYQAVSDNFDPQEFASSQDITLYNMTDERGVAEVVENWGWDYIDGRIALGWGAPNPGWRADGGQCFDDLLVGWVVWQLFKGEWVENDRECYSCTTQCTEAWDYCLYDVPLGTYPTYDPNNQEQFIECVENGEYGNNLQDVPCVNPETLPPEEETNCAWYNNCYGLYCGPCAGTDLDLFNNMVSACYATAGIEE